MSHVRILVGTHNGAFILSADGSRHWRPNCGRQTSSLRRPVPHPQCDPESVARRACSELMSLLDMG